MSQLNVLKFKNAVINREQEKETIFYVRMG